MRAAHSTRGRHVTYAMCGVPGMPDMHVLDIAAVLAVLAVPAVLAFILYKNVIPWAHYFEHI